MPDKNKGGMSQGGKTPNKDTNKTTKTTNPGTVNKPGDRETRK